MGRILFWGIILILASIAMLYLPWIVIVGQEQTDEGAISDKSFKSVMNSKGMCDTDAPIENSESFCKTVKMIEICAYVILGLGVVFFLVGVVWKK